MFNVEEGDRCVVIEVEGIIVWKNLSSGWMKELSF